MEELLVSQRYDLIVDPVEQSVITLCDCGCDGVKIAEGVDADSEARVYLSPCKNFGVVGGESISSAVKQGIVSFCISMIFLKLNIRIILGEIGLGGRSLSRCP